MFTPTHPVTLYEPTATTIIEEWTSHQRLPKRKIALSGHVGCEHTSSHVNSGSQRGLYKLRGQEGFLQAGQV